MNTKINEENLPVMEEFYSLQGEGFHTGEAAYFIRIGGCDVGCHFCDVKEAWNAAIHNPAYVYDIVERVSEVPAKAVIITGGEPMLYNLDTLCFLLKEKGIRTFLETSGTSPLSGTWDWICLSPKENAETLSKYYDVAGELKMIICHEDDFERAEYHAAKIIQKNPNCQLYLQPEWSVRKEITPLIIEYIKQYPKWKISQQTHKYIDIR